MLASDDEADKEKAFKPVLPKLSHASNQPSGGARSTGALQATCSRFRVSRFIFELLPLKGGMIVNYGLDRLRFPAPVPVGSRIRGRLRIEEVRELTGGHELKLLTTIEREGGDKPVCVALVLLRQYG